MVITKMWIQNMKYADQRSSLNCNLSAKNFISKNRIVNILFVPICFI